MSAFPLLARILYQFTFQPVYFYPGLGAGILFADIKVASANTGKSEVAHPYLLLAGFLGAAIKAGPGRVFIELGYWNSHVDESWVKGNLGGFHGTAGYELEF